MTTKLVKLTNQEISATEVAAFWKASWQKVQLHSKENESYQMENHLWNVESQLDASQTTNLAKSGMLRCI